MPTHPAYRHQLPPQQRPLPIAAVRYLQQLMVSTEALARSLQGGTVMEGQ